jgi:hypothetical protein
MAQRPTSKEVTPLGGSTPATGGGAGFVLTQLDDYLCDWKPLPPAAGGIGEAPEDAKLYGRKDAAWEEVVIPAAPPGGIDEAPEDGALYGRRDAGWEEIVIPAIPPSGIEEAPEDGLVYGRKDASWDALEDGVEEAPEDSTPYARQDAGWVAIPDAPPGGIGEAPENGELYGRKNGAWEEIIIPPAVDLNDYLPLAGGQMTGALLLAGMPTTAAEAANRGYVDTQIGNLPPPNDFTKLEADTLYLSLGGGSITGHLFLLAGNPVDPRQAVTRSYVDAEIGRVPPIPPDLLTKTEASTTYIPLVGNLFSPMTGPLVLMDAAPAQPNYAAPRGYVDTQISDLIHRSGDTMTGRLYLAEGPVDEDYQATHKSYVDDAIAAAIGGGGGGGDFLPLAGGTLLGPLLLADDPTEELGAATRQYVDRQLGGSGGPFLPLTGGKLDGPGNLEVMGEILARGNLTALGAGGLRIIPPGEGVISFQTTSSGSTNSYRIVVNNTQGNNRMRIESMTSGVPQYRTLIELDGSVGGTGKVRMPQGGTSPLPTGPDDIVNKSYIDGLISSGGLYQGQWSVGANSPDLMTAPRVPGNRYLCKTADPDVPERCTANIPGLFNETIAEGAFVIWDGGLQQYGLIRGASLTQDQADLRYIRRDGDTVPGQLTLTPAMQTSPNDAAHRGYVDVQLYGPWLNITLPAPYQTSTIQGRLINGGTSVEIRGALIGNVTTAYVPAFTNAVPAALRPPVQRWVVGVGEETPVTLTGYGQIIFVFHPNGSFQFLVFRNHITINRCYLDGLGYSIGTGAAALDETATVN